MTEIPTLSPVTWGSRQTGRSSPNAADDWQGALLDNNTATLVADCEAIRKVLEVEKWGVVQGGSWGSTLALAFAEVCARGSHACTGALGHQATRRGF